MKYLIISDLHLNMGKPGGVLHPLEDYDSDDAFSSLIEMALKSGAELIINGDWVDFLQLEPFVPLGDYRSQDGIPLGWTAETAEKKLETCLSAHRQHFDDLARYMKAGGKVTIMQGNHDCDWYFPAEASGDEPPLQKQLREAVGKPAGEALRFIETSIRLGSAHVEHGHQLCEFANAFQNHPKIFHTDRKSPLTGKLRFELLWGSRFVVEFFNQLETQYPFADNLKPTTRTLLLGIREGWVNGAMAKQALQFFWGSGLPWKDGGELLDGPKTPLEMIQGLQDDELKATFLKRYMADPGFREELNRGVQSLSDKERRGLHRNARSETENVQILEHEDPVTLGLFRPVREIRSAKRLLGEAGVTAVIFGHTHQEIDGNAKEAPVAGYFNTGTWTPRFDLGKRENRELLARGLPVEILKDRKYFELRLMYAEVSVDGNGSRVELKEKAG